MKNTDSRFFVQRVLPITQMRVKMSKRHSKKVPNTETKTISYKYIYEVKTIL